MKPLITVIIPAYNCEKTIATAIESILAQTYPNIEIIVVDDKSTDDTKKVAESFAARNPQVRVFDGQDDPWRFDVKINRNVNAGWSARNTGLQHARGEYITFQDADDACLLNRIEVQYDLLIEYGSTHLCIDWIQFNDKYIGKKLDVSAFKTAVLASSSTIVIGPDELYAMSQRSKGIVAKISKRLNIAIPFYVKRMRIINKLFFGSLENYPGPGNSPMFKRNIIDKVQFRPLSRRIWPSFMGRGADKDFNFQVAETFKNSHVVFMPLYLWRVKNENPRLSKSINSYLL
jgi:glycosyltransferase involved in cell wall biosynthesis